MVITHFSKDSKRGFAVGGNFLSKEKLKAGGIALAGGFLIALVGGLVKGRRGAKPAKKKKRRLWLALLPAGYSAAKTAVQNRFVSDLTESVSETAEQLGLGGVETVPAEPLAEEAIPISSEEEIYDHI